MDYILKILINAEFYGQHAKTYLHINGEHNSGKTKMFSVLYELYHGACGQLSYSVLGGKERNDKPSPQLFKAIARTNVMICDEAKILNAEKVKLIASPEGVFPIRTLSKSSTLIQPSPLVVLTANSIPFCPGTDSGVEDRHLQCPVSVGFHKNAPPSPLQQLVLKCYFRANTITSATIAKGLFWIFEAIKMINVIIIAENKCFPRNQKLPKLLKESTHLFLQRSDPLYAFENRVQLQKMEGYSISVSKKVSEIKSFISENKEFKFIDSCEIYNRLKKKIY
jgi:hypothetical protein